LECNEECGNRDKVHDEFLTYEDQEEAGRDSVYLGGRFSDCVTRTIHLSTTAARYGTVAQIFRKTSGHSNILSPLVSQTPPLALQ
jgi:hypothetical protein